MIAPVIHLRATQQRRQGDRLALERDDDSGGLVVFIVAYLAGIATGVMLFAAFLLERST